MYAVIHEIDSTATHGLIPIAGRPLVARQIQWLRAARCQGIAVQIGSSAESVALGRWLTRGDAIGTNVRLVLSGLPLSPHEIARRAGFPDNATLLAIPADVLCGGNMEMLDAYAEPRGAIANLSPPAGLADAFDGGAIRVFGKPQISRETNAEMWGVRVHSLADAFAIGVAVLEGRLERRAENGVLLHASERARGIWVSRGAHIDATAKLVPPILVGSDAVIRADACVGPRVFLGDRSVIDRRTRLTDSLVAPGTIIGEDLELSGVAIDARGTQDLFTGEHATIDETLLLARRDKPLWGTWLGKVLVVLAIIVTAPIWLSSHIVYWRDRRRTRAPARISLSSALKQTIRGERSCIGLSDWNDDIPADISPALIWKSMSAPSGLIAIDAGLVPDDADVGTLLRARVYYMHEKNPFLDMKLLVRCLQKASIQYVRKFLGIAPQNASQRMGAWS